MTQQRTDMWLWVVTLVTVNLLTIMFVNVNPGTSAVMPGYVLGSLFAQVTLAAAWGALGSEPFRLRFPLSLAWAAMFAIAFGINIRLYGASSGISYVIGVCLFIQWLFLQLPLWSLALRFRLQLRSIQETDLNETPDRQYGIRDLLIVIAIAGGALGAGRLVFGPFLPTVEDVISVLLLALNAASVTLPLLLATLWRRWTIARILAALVFVVVVSTFELLILLNIRGGGSREMTFFVWLNVFSSAVILAVAGSARLCGYWLGATKVGSGGAASGDSPSDAR